MRAKVKRFIRRYVQFGKLPYRERSKGKFADLRDVEVRLPRKRWVRLTFNGQYRRGRAYHDTYRSSNPGWSLGTQWVFLNWVHFRRHCWHVSLDVRHRGVTFSYGRKVV